MRRVGRCVERHVLLVVAEGLGITVSDDEAAALARAHGHAIARIADGSLPVRPVGR